MRYAGPREALFHASSARTTASTISSWAATTPAWASSTGRSRRSEIFDRFTPAELGVTPLKSRADVLLPRLRRARLAAHLPARRGQRLELSGTKVREILRAGGHLPAEFTRPEVAEILREHYIKASGRRATGRRRDAAAAFGTRRPASSSGSPACPAPARARWPRRCRAGSASGRSRSWTATRCARTCRRASASRGRTATPTSAASATSRGCWPNGVGVITAAISPYADTRDEVRQAAERDGVAVRRGVRARRARRAGGARREGPLQEGAGRRDRATSPACPIRTRRRTTPTWSCAATARRSRRASTASCRRWRTRGLVDRPPAVVGDRPCRRGEREPPLFPVFLKLAGRRSWWSAAGGRRVKARRRSTAGAHVTVVAPDVVGAVAELRCDRAPRVRAVRPRRRVVRGGRGAARGEPRGRRGGRGAPRLRQRRRRPADATAYLGGVRAPRRRDGGDLDRGGRRRWPACCARGSTRCCPRPRGWVAVARARARRPGGERRCPSPSAGRCCWRRSTGSYAERRRSQEANA